MVKEKLCVCNKALPEDRLKYCSIDCAKKARKDQDKERNKNPERRERNKAYLRVYRQKPEVIAKRKSKSKANNKGRQPKPCIICGKIRPLEATKYCFDCKIIVTKRQQKEQDAKKVRVGVKVRKPLTREQKNALRRARYVLKTPEQRAEGKQRLIDSKSAENNPQWKGDSAGYGSIHEWVRRRKPKPKLCVRCNQRPAIDLANISQEYLRNVDDYEWLCRKCHMEDDGRLANGTIRTKVIPYLRKVNI